MKILIKHSYKVPNRRKHENDNGARNYKGTKKEHINTTAMANRKSRLSSNVSSYINIYKML